MAAKKKASKKRKSGTKTPAKSKRSPQPLSDDQIEVPKVEGMLSHRTTEGPEGAALRQAMQELAGQINKDKAHKVITHLMYLTEDWTWEMGGCFRILGSGDANDVHAEIPPLLNNSVVLKRTDDAWHSVSAIPRGCTRSRKLLQVWFWGAS